MNKQDYIDQVDQVEPGRRIKILLSLIFAAVLFIATVQSVSTYGDDDAFLVEVVDCLFRPVPLGMVPVYSPHGCVKVETGAIVPWSK